ncbi:MAG: methyltransferase domain-containing protein [Gemmatimonadaceae bacterium]
MPAYDFAPGCPACGADADEEVASADDVRAELEALWDFHTRRLDPATPPERLTDRLTFSQRPPLRLVRCASCGLVYRNPRERAWELTDAYAGEEPTEKTMRALFETQRGAYRSQARRLTAVAGRAGRGLEVGSYVGGFLAASRELGWHFEGLDINAAAQRFAEGLGHTVHAGEIEALAAAAPAPYDAVAFWNCLDQLPDPRAALAAAARLTRPGGVLAVRVPSGAFYSNVRRLIAAAPDRGASRASRWVRAPLVAAACALLAHNNLLAFPYRFGFSVPALRRAFAAAGFRVVRVAGDSLVPIADRYTRPWARWEEWVVKRALRAAAAARADAAPWIEVYGVREQGG